MSKTPWREIREKPATTCIIAICAAVWIAQHQRYWTASEAGTNYHAVIERRQYWRLLLSQITHNNTLHLLLNMRALWTLGAVERRRGVVEYCRVTVILMIGSKLLLMACYLFMIKVAKREHYRWVSSVGYSSVVFGWMAALSVGRKKLREFHMIGTWTVPMSLAPFVSLITTAIAIPESSFFGHLTGIIMGYAIGFYDL